LVPTGLPLKWAQLHQRYQGLLDKEADHACS
jgi:hypothetical protein